jgi:hypothetical protein
MKSLSLSVIAYAVLWSTAGLAFAQGQPSPDERPQPPQPAGQAAPPAPPASPPAPARPGRPAEIGAPAERGDTVRADDTPPPGDARRPEPNAVLDDLLTRVAADTGRQFIVDFRVPERIYVRGTVGEASLDYPALLAVLRGNGLAAVEIGGYVHIVADAAVRQLPTRVVNEDDPNVADNEIVTRVLTIPPGGASATTLVPLLRPMQPQYAHLSASAERDQQGGGTLVIVDHYANVKRISEVVEAIVAASRR